MKWDKKDGSYILSTGRRVDAIMSTFGICEIGGIDAVSGYDGSLCIEGSRGDEKFTPEEKTEIADYVSNLWKKWANQGR